MTDFTDCWSDPLALGKLRLAKISSVSKTIKSDLKVPDIFKPVIFPQKPETSLLPVNADDKRVIGGICDINQLCPMRYEWSWDYFLKANELHWTPTETNLAKDFYAFKNTLSFDEINTIKNSLSFLAVSSVLSMRVIGLGFMEKMSAPELQIFNARIMYEKALHSWSYQYIFESLGIDSKSIYQSYKQISEISQIINCVDEYVSSINTANMDFNDKKQILIFVKSYVFFSAIFEGVWIQNALIPLLALCKYRGLKGLENIFTNIYKGIVNHSEFGFKIIKHILAENLVKIDIAFLNEMKGMACGLYNNYADLVINNSLSSCNLDEFKEYSCQLVDDSFSKIGLIKQKTINNISFPWLFELQGNVSHSPDVAQVNSPLRWD
ncbi:MAG: ribonucleotide-diphosphate reductase subunit beta [Pseudomonadota bacterium]